MIKFSLILNSRHRPQLLSNLLDSILFKTANIDEIEVLISADSDDNLTQSYFSKFNTTWGGFLPAFASIEYIERDQNLHRRMNNMVKKCKGKYIWPLNDDCIIHDNSQNWDTKCWSILEEAFQDNIVLGHVSCTSVDKEAGGQYSSFPIVSKYAINSIGYLISEDLPGLGGDVYLWRIFSNITRIVNLPLQVRHLLHENVADIMNCDRTAAEMRHTTKSGADCWTIDIDTEINKLKHAISN